MSSSEEVEFDDDDGEQEEEEEAYEEEEEEDDDDADDDDYDDDEPISRLKKSASKRRIADDDDDDEDEESDEDDVPLSALKSPPPKKKDVKTKTKTSKAKKPAATKKKTPAKAKKPEKSKAKSSSTKRIESSSSATNNDYRSVSEALYVSDCKKGQLIQRLLCRWWYAMTWPDPDALLAEPPPHYDSLDGFPGVYVCTSSSSSNGAAVGSLLDVRDHTQCPNFRNLAHKSSAELRTLLLTALEKQKIALLEAEGKGTPTEKEINDMIKWANKLNVNAADKEAVKVLKTAKLSLDSN